MFSLLSFGGGRCDWVCGCVQLDYDSVAFVWDDALGVAIEPEPDGVVWIGVVGIGVGQCVADAIGDVFELVFPEHDDMWDTCALFDRV